VLCSVAEGKPLALTEAMVCGRPAVVTDVGGNAELIRDGVTGFVAASPTVPAISDALERAWTSRARWPDMGRAAAADVTARLSPAPAARLLSLVRAVGAPGARSGRA
jgi:glycosyltransferase involved in cell wall biosynthesis